MSLIIIADLDNILCGLEVYKRNESQYYPDKDELPVDEVMMDERKYNESRTMFYLCGFDWLIPFVFTLISIMMIILQDEMIFGKG